MIKVKMILPLPKYPCSRFVAVFMLFFGLLMFPSYSQAGVIRGKVTATKGNVMELDVGVEKGIRSGDPGKVYYNILIDGKEKPIFIAKFKITHLSEKSSMAQIEDKTGEVRAGYLVEITVKEGTLEVRSEPPGAKIYVDGKEAGETPGVLSNVRVGGHVVRMSREGYKPYEEQVKVGEGERKKVSVSLKRITGALLVNTDPPGATIFIDDKSVGASPYEGKDLPSGPHKVKVVKEGYEPWEKDVMVEAGKAVEVFTMLRWKGITPFIPPLKPVPPKARDSKAAEVQETPPKLDLTQKTCEAPVWNVGDKWIYKKVTGEIYSFDVVDSKEDFFLLKVTGIQDLRAYDKKTMNLLFLIGKDGRRIEVKENPFKKVLNFPISVGKEWNDNVRSQAGVNYIVDLKIEGIEEVISNVGRFKAYKIFFKETSMASFSSGWVRYWYTPEVKMWVKIEVEKTPFWTSQTWLQDTELIYYKLK